MDVQMLYREMHIFYFMNHHISALAPRFRRDATFVHFLDRTLADICSMEKSLELLLDITVGISLIMSL